MDMLLLIIDLMFTFFFLVSRRWVGCQSVKVGSVGGWAACVCD